MGLTKSEIFTDEQNKLASAFKVLGHPARVAILQHIINQKACICNDLVDELGLAQATISQHLKELKNLGIIQGTVEGKSVCYCIDDKIWKEIQNEFNAFFNQEVKVNNCCS
ncbi:metalloregulator ArsR/SmtB family transcription factor [Chryseobacterium arthrosphaerae]|uniref:ArsR/SmtB family transcription factor n=1 Tax=Chryseobacterium arthrosphaerae TaxID=651561 RepID=UPI0023E19ACB|nr:metalloregulator ArsR/SmtB family transcription factor [Chryseobacterium arthrosphaerae]WES99863.1 metalloregulator ArsR/SmtB family transcription factor [Chryseobacterium arthrosphaerae]